MMIKNKKNKNRTLNFKMQKNAGYFKFHNSILEFKITGIFLLILLFITMKHIYDSNVIVFNELVSGPKF